MSGQNPNEERESGLSVQEGEPELREPPMYKVLLLNDDYTPMEFVVLVDYSRSHQHPLMCTMEEA